MKPGSFDGPAASRSEDQRCRAPRGVSTATVSRAWPHRKSDRIRADGHEGRARDRLRSEPRRAKSAHQRTRTSSRCFRTSASVSSLVLRGISDSWSAGLQSDHRRHRNESAREAQFANSSWPAASRRVAAQRPIASHGPRCAPFTTPTVSLCERIPGASFPHVETENASPPGP